MLRLAALLPFLIAGLLKADGGPARKEIESACAQSIQAMKQAKTMDDLDAMNKAMNTPDWVGIMPGQKPQTWEQLRRYGFENLNQPFDETSFLIDRFTMTGEDAAIVQGTVRVTATLVDQRGQFGAKGEKHTIVTTAPIRDTCVKTPDGWRRKIHEKLVANKPMVDGKPFEPPARPADPRE